MEQKKGKKVLRTFAWASFLNDFGSDIVSPLWPIFVTSVLGANMAVLGLIDGLGEAVVSISQAVSGFISDKVKKRKIFIWLGYLLAGVARIGYALSSTWHYVIPFKILDRLGKLRGTPRDAIIADFSNHNNRAGNFGYLRMMDNLGAVCGIVFTILFFQFLGYTKLFFIAAIPSLVGSVLIFTLIKENKASGNGTYRRVSWKDFNLDFRILLFMGSIFALASFSYSFLLVFAKQFGVAIALIPFLYLVYNLTASAFSLPFGKLADATTRKFVLYLSFIFWILVCLSFIFFQKNLIVIFIAFILYGLHKGALDPIEKTLVSEFAKPELKASTLGGYQMIVGLCALPASFIAGLLWDKVSVSAPFYFSLMLTLISMVLLSLVKENKGNN